jgi:hypothetical protein
MYTKEIEEILKDKARRSKMAERIGITMSRLREELFAIKNDSILVPRKKEDWFTTVTTRFAVVDALIIDVLDSKGADESDSV